jgi:hypothetical protein
MKKYLYNSRRILIISLLSVVVVAAGCTWAKSAPEKTDLLKPKVGYTGELIGAEVQRVTPMATEGIIEIVVLIPENSEKIETVTIINKEGKKIKPAKQFEFSKDAEGNPNGVILYLAKPRRLPFRLRFNNEIQ